MNPSLRAEECRLQQIRRLTEVSRAITYAMSLDEVFQLTVDCAADLLSAERSLLLIADDEGLLALRSSYPADAVLAQSLREPMDEALIPNLAARLHAGPGRFLGVPVVVNGAIEGVLVVIRPAASTPVAEDEWFLSALADQAAVGLEKRRLDEIGVYREQLIGIIGHDLRNPLNTIMMAGQLLLQLESLGEEETELARKIMSSASLAARLIGQLLDLTRSRLGGGLPLTPSRFDMNDVCRQVIGETELMHPDRPLRVDMRGDLTGVWDRDRMYQLLANLVGNAVQHGEPRSAIGLRIHGGETDILIDVTNRGNPIPPVMQPLIFHAFRQGRTDERSRTQGLGLGLFISQEIARSHGGSIAVTSSESEGTTFRVRLPRIDAPTEAPAPPDSR